MEKQVGWRLGDELKKEEGQEDKERGEVMLSELKWWI